MVDSVLLNPSNRLLGWSTGDLSYYGAQPAVTVGERGGWADPTLVTVPTGSLAAVPEIARVAAPPTAANRPIPGEDPAPATAPSSAGLTGFSPQTSNPSIAPAQPSTPAAQGGGSLAPQPPVFATAPQDTAASAVAAPQMLAAAAGPSALIAPVLPASLHDIQASTTALAPALALLQAPVLAPLANEVVQPLGELLHATVPAALDQLAAAGTTLLQTVGPLTEAATDGLQMTVAAVAAAPAPALDAVLATADDLGETAAAATATAIDFVADTPAAVAEAAMATAATSTDLISTATQTAAAVTTDSATAAVDTVADATSALSDAVSPAAQTVAEEVAVPAVATAQDVATTTLATAAEPLAAPVVDTLDGLGGSDPAGGVTTLMTMVDSADAFDLAHAGTEPSPITAAASMIDTLAAEPSETALIGEAADHAHDLIGLGDDHHAGGLI